MFVLDVLSIPRPLRLVEDKDVLRRHKRTLSGVALDVVLHTPDKCLSVANRAQFVLKHFDKWAVPREKHRRRRRFAAAAVDRQSIEPVRVPGLQPDKRLAGSRNSGHEHEAPSLRRRGIPDDPRNLGARGIGGGRSALHATQAARLEEFAGGAHERWKRPIRIILEEPRTTDRSSLRMPVELLDEIVECIRPADEDPLLSRQPTLRSHRHEHRIHGNMLAVAVIAAQITRVCRDLIDIGLRRHVLPLQFEDDDRAIDEEDDIRPPRLEGKLVLEDRRVFRCHLGSGCGDRLSDLALQRRHRVPPRRDLRITRIGDESLQRGDDLTRARAREGRKVRIPTTSCVFAHGRSLPSRSRDLEYAARAIPYPLGAASRARYTVCDGNAKPAPCETTTSMNARFKRSTASR